MQLFSHWMAPKGDRADRMVVWMAGILGKGNNWRSIASDVMKKCPETAAVLLDLRGHGQSPRGESPHGLRDVAADVVETVAALARDRGVKEVVLSGHSYGGKVAIAARQLWGDPIWAARTDGVALVDTWIFDSMLSAAPDRFGDRQGGVMRILDLLVALPEVHASRDAFVDAAVAAGIPAAVATWQTTNLERREDGSFVLPFDWQQINAMIENYFATCAWTELALADSGLGPAMLVVGGASDTVSAEDRERVITVPGHALFEVPEAGHWLHAEKPKEVGDLAAQRLGHDAGGQPTGQ